MAEDIAPKMLKNILADFRGKVGRNERIKKINKRIDSGNADYKDAYYYASEIGAILMQVFATHIKAKNLPDQKLYYNIANRVVRIPLEKADAMVIDTTARIQESINKKQGIGLRVIV